MKQPRTLQQIACTLAATEIAARMQHRRDEQCTLGEDDCCIVCHVYHGEPCPECYARGYHKPGCNEMPVIELQTSTPIDRDDTTTLYLVQIIALGEEFIPVKRLENFMALRNGKPCHA